MNFRLSRMAHTEISHYVVLRNRNHIQNARMSATKQVQKFALIYADIVLFGLPGNFQ